MSPTSSCLSLPLRLDDSTGGKSVSVRSSARASIESSRGSRTAHVPSKERKGPGSKKSNASGTPIQTMTKQSGASTQRMSKTLTNDFDRTRNSDRLSPSPRVRTPTSSTAQQGTPARRDPTDTAEHRSAHNALRRKPSAIATFISDLHAAAATEVSSNVPGPQSDNPGADHDLAVSPQHASPIAVGQPIFAATRFTVDQQNDTLTNKTELDICRNAQSPGFYSEASATPSLQQSMSPVSVFTHATALTSRTSYSSLYSATPCSTRSTPSSSIPAKIRRNGSTATGPPTTQGTPFREPFGRQLPVLQEDRSKEKRMSTVRSESNSSLMSERPLKAAISLNDLAQARFRRSPLSHGATPIITTPSELAHLGDKDVTAISEASNLTQAIPDVPKAISARQPVILTGTSLHSHPLERPTSIMQDTAGMRRKATPTGQARSEVPLSLVNSQTPQPSNCMPSFGKTRATSPLATSAPPTKQPLSGDQKMKSSRPSFGFGWHREKGNQPVSKEASKGFARTKLDALRQYASKGKSSKNATTSTTSNNKSPGTNPRTPERRVRPQKPLDPFLSSRLEPVYIRGAASTFRPENTIPVLSKAYATNPGFDDKNSAQQSSARSREATVASASQHISVTTSTTAPDQSSTPTPQRHDLRPAEQTLHSTQLPHDKARPQVGNTNHSNGGHWSLFPKGTHESSVQKKGFLRRALSLASKKSPTTGSATTPTISIAPQSVTEPNTVVDKPSTPTSRTPSGAKRMSDGEHALKESPSKKILTEAQFRRSTLIDVSERSEAMIASITNCQGDVLENVSKRGLKPRNDVVVQKSDNFGFRNIQCDFSPNSVRDRGADRRRKRPHSGVLKPLSMNPGAAQHQERTRKDETRNVTTDVGKTSRSSTPPKVIDLPNGQENTSSTPAEQTLCPPDKPTSNLERVLEDELLSFSESRNSVSSLTSSSGTLYFPVAPTHPPIATLPKLPDYARGFQARPQIPVKVESPVPIEEQENVPRNPISPPSSFIAVRSTSSQSRKSERIENVKDPVVEKEAPSLTNLRFASLMTSKWLSFGRVLLSNVAADDRILVIDGLGKDWSYYCALTYPTAKIYTLSAGSLRSKPSSISGLQPPPNHKDIPYPNVNGRFPFTDNFFTATIFRFPLATTDAALHHMVSECTRVLRPGGHMEVSAVDLDLANMGSRARRSVRELKTTIRSSHPEICLKPVSDNIQLLLGQCGFRQLSRCVLGIPAAGPVAESRQSMDDKSRSFGELMKDSSAHNDQGIAKMVSKVGRWWYAQCYESGDLQHSIWSDELLLKECEQLHTAFKLYICYAQKPMGELSSASSSFEM